ncbi:hypothetical protein, partial [Cellulomonas sp. NPDC089187]|uniref:hypothetical protein n=1 Tax=Cellulomonas sp. NPDC089187 TaxID=3154970 RepID=UPI00341EFB02
MVAAALMLVGLSALPAQAAGQASGLTIKVTADGTAPWDSSDESGYDSSPSNGRVRTHDYVTYQWGYSVATAGDVTLVQTLPENMSWVVTESAAACAEGVDAVSADGRTITCTRQHPTTGASTYQVKALVDYGYNGQVLSTALTSAGTADSAPAEVTVTAAPTFDLDLGAGSASYATGGASGTEPGYIVRYRIRIYQPIDPVRGVRGSEPLSDTFSFQVDPSAVSADARVNRCALTSGSNPGVGGYNLYPTVAGGASTTANSLPGRGEWTCAQSAPGQPITMTVTGAVTDVRSYPTQDIGGNALDIAGTRALVTGNELLMWFPSADVLDRTISVPLHGFDPDSASGQSNYGTGFATGQEPDATPQPGVNTLNYAITARESLSLGLGWVFPQTGPLGWESAAPEGATSLYSGDAPMRRGQTLRYGGYVQNTSGSGTTYTNASFCATFDESLLSPGGLTTAVPVAGIEYGHLDMTSDAQRRSTLCGPYGSGGDQWSDTLDGAGGAGVVNAVRFSYDTLLANQAVFFALEMTRSDLPQQTGAALPVFWQSQNDQTGINRSDFNPAIAASNSLGGKARALDTEVSVDLSWPSLFGLPGERYTMTAQPVL